MAGSDEKNMAVLSTAFLGVATKNQKHMVEMQGAIKELIDSLKAQSDAISQIPAAIASLPAPLVNVKIEEFSELLEANTEQMRLLANRPTPKIDVLASKIDVSGFEKALASNTKQMDNLAKAILAGMRPPGQWYFEVERDLGGYIKNIKAVPKAERVN